MRWDARKPKKTDSLQAHTNWYSAAGFVVESQTETSAFVVKPKGEFSLGWFLVSIVPYLIYHIFLKSELVLHLYVEDGKVRDLSAKTITRRQDVITRFKSPAWKRLEILRAPSGQLIVDLKVMGWNDVIRPLTEWEAAQVEAESVDVDQTFAQGVFERLNPETRGRPPKESSSASTGDVQ